MSYMVRVAEVETGREHELPADAVTRDVECSRGPLLPLGFRPPGAVFFVTSRRWPELSGKALKPTRR